MKITFTQLPHNLAELKQCPQASLEKPEYTVALLVASFCNYGHDKEATYEMLTYLYGPTGFSNYDKSFLHDRIAYTHYVPFSYFEGATADNFYTPTQPYTIEVLANAVSYAQAGVARLLLKSGGADSARPVILRLKPSENKWYVVEQLLLGQIRIPKELDPWA